jgi:hypothetical protein
MKIGYFLNAEGLVMWLLPGMWKAQVWSPFHKNKNKTKLSRSHMQLRKCRIHSVTGSQSSLGSRVTW